MFDPALIPYVLAAVVVVVVVVVVAARRRSGWEDALSAPDDSPSGPSTGAARAGSAAAAPPIGRPAPDSLFDRLVSGLSRTKDRLVSRMDELFEGRKVIDAALWQQLEELLVTSDVGIRATTRLLERMKKQAAKDELQDPRRLRALLRSEVETILGRTHGALPAEPERRPYVIMVVGVNGAGKTTTIGKLAARYVAAGKRVIIGAGDTFRAAAIEQVVVWGKRSGAEVVKHGAGADPAAVAHDAVSAGGARHADVVICDTAGRLHSKDDLMAELGKVHRVIGKVHAGGPDEVLLVLDATNGQNALEQARVFTAAVGVTGIVLTKLDGTAKGGVVIAIADELDIPVKLIGVGEAVDDLRDFEPDAFVRALFDGADLGRGGNSRQAAARDAELGIEAVSEDGGSDARTQG